MGKCSKCGNEIDDNAKFCSKCGTPVGDKQSNEVSPQNGIAPCGIAGFIVALIAIFFSNYGYMQLFILAIPALCLSILGMLDKKHLKHGLAIAGLVLSIIAILLSFNPPAKLFRTTVPVTVEVEMKQ